MSFFRKQSAVPRTDRPGAFSAVPTGLVTLCLGFPGLTSWATLSRPFGTGPDTPDRCIDVKENRVGLVDRLSAFACGPSETAGPSPTLPRISRPV
jgi:hypothetical protein